MSKLVNDFARLTEAQIEIDKKLRKNETLTDQESTDFHEHMDLDMQVRVLFHLFEEYTKEDIVGMLDKFEEFNSTK